MVFHNSVFSVAYRFPLFGFFSFTLFLNTHISLRAQALTAEQIFKRVSGAVVLIQGLDENNQVIKQGSGVIIKEKGYVITNYHVLVGCNRIEILRNKEKIPPLDLIGIDVDKDILIIQIGKNSAPKLKTSNSDRLNVGQKIYAIGNPLGLENTMSEGIISGLRNYSDVYKNFIQITASISPGSSGGAIVNDKGELIGISTLSLKGGQNINFAIPINEIMKVRINSYGSNNDFKDYEFYYNGNEAFGNQEFDQAIKYYKKFLTKYPNRADVYHLMGLASAVNGDKQGAIQFYSQAIEIDSNYLDAYCNRASMKADLGDYEGAKNDFNKALEINNLSSTTYCLIAKMELQYKNYHEAIHNCNIALNLDPEQHQAYFYRGSAKLYLEDYRGAIQDMNKAINISPLEASYYKSRGVCKWFAGDTSGACDDYSKAGELGDLTAYELIKRACK